MSLETAVFRILGIRGANDPARLLGIPTWDRSVVALETALRIRFAQILSHPMRNSPEAELVLKAIKEAGIKLRVSCLPVKVDSSKSNTTAHSLTDLDRSIIAVLVSEGGWNRQSRGRLVGVAAAYGLTVGGLLRVLTALAESARSGQGPLSLEGRKTITPDRSWVALPLTSNKQGLVDELLDEAAAKLLPEFKDQAPEAVIKLSVLFGLLTILAFVLALMVLSQADKDAERAVAIAKESARLMQGGTQFQPSTPIRTQQLCFAEYPTFHEDIFTSEVGMFVDLAPDIPRTLRELVSEISSSGARGVSVNDQFLIRWDQSISTISSIWPFLDKQLQEEVSSLVLEAFARSPQVNGLTKKLLSVFTLGGDYLNSDFLLIRQPWLLSELARLTCSSELIPSTKDLLRNITNSYKLDCDVWKMRRRTLRQLAVELSISTELNPNVFLLWEQWIAMVKRDEDTVIATALTLDTIDLLLQGTVDLTRESNTRKVLGRLVKEIDWIRNDVARDKLLELFVNSQFSAIDIWAISNMLFDLQAIPWFLPSHRVAIIDSIERREEIADNLAQHWPVSTSPTAVAHTLVLPAGFDSTLISIWKELTLQCKDQSFTSAQRFSRARRLNEIAASIWIGRPSHAWELVDVLDQSISYDEDLLQNSGGRSSGQLSSRFVNTNRDADAMMDLLSFVRSSQFADLHPKDAALIARAALFHGDIAIRQEAVSLICDHFSRTSEVAEALVNVLTPNAKSQQVEALVAFLTDVILPPRHHSQWTSAVRRALIQHALTAGQKDLYDLDAAASTAAVSAIGEALAVDPTRLQPTSEVTVQGAYDYLLEAWKRKLGLRRSFTSSSVTLDSDGVLQQHLQQQLQYVMYIQTLEKIWSQVPIREDDLLDVVHSKSLVEQICNAEIAALTVWNRMLTLANEELQKEIK